MKRALALVLAAGLLLSASGCRKVWEQSEVSDLVEAIGEITQNAKEAVRNVAEAAQQTITEGSLGITHSVVEFEVEEELPGFSVAEFQAGTLSEAAYYQYAALSQKDKEMYRAVVSAVRNGKTTVKIAEYGYNTDQVFRVYRAVTTDHPEFFFLAKSFLYTVSSGTVGKLILQYSDGEKSDQYDKKGKLAQSADRTKIERQIDEFSKEIVLWQEEIDTDTDVWGVEKQLHDIIIDRVEYDDIAAEEADDPDAAETHAFDVYGAVCEGMAVCEGYAKLFEYLCYCYGINCTTVSGLAKGGDHMWNAVKLNGSWTMVDVTWDDAEEDGIRFYRYFNLTEEQMKEDHEPGEKDLSVPKCTSEEGAFSRRFAFSVSSFSEPPDNFIEVLDRLASGKDRFVALIADGSERAVSRYINREILYENSFVQQYIKQLDYGIAFSGDVYIADGCYYLLLS